MSAARMRGIEYRSMEVDGAPLPGRYFDCSRLVAVLSAETCARRWEVAAEGSACASCEIGRAHSRQCQTNRSPRSCLRCGRTGMRVLPSVGLCLSCSNREAEWRRGRNSKGSKPTMFEPLQRRVVAICLVDGTVVYRELQTRHDAEALGLIARRYLPEGATFTDEQPGRCHWHNDPPSFEYRDPAGQPLIVLKRADGELRYRPMPPEGMPQPYDLPQLPGWKMASYRQQVSLLDVGMAALVLSINAEDEFPSAWTPTGFACAHCRRSPLEARRTEDQAGFDVRCPACGKQHLDEAVAG